ncbi:MAG: methyl-accepting chemotaxis protein [Bacillota bacterium]
MHYRTRMILVMTALAVLCSMVAGLLFYRVAAKTYEHDLESRLTAAAGAGALAVDPNDHGLITSTEDKTGIPYRAIQAVLQKLAINTNAGEVYTLVKRDGQIVFVVDADDTEDAADVGEEMEPDDAVEAAFSGQISFTKEFYTDQWGTWKTAYAPIRDYAGKVVGVLGIDMSADQIARDKQVLLYAIGGAAMASVILALLLSIWFSGRLSRPLRQTAAALEQIAANGGDLTQVLPVTSRDEFGALATAVNKITSYNRDMVLKIRGLTLVVDQAVEMIRQAAEQNRRAMEEIVAGSGQVAAGAQDSAERTATATELMVELNQALEQVASHTNETADTFVSSTAVAQQGSQAVDRAKAQTDAVQSSISSLRQAIGLLSDRSTQIEQVVGIIADIAKQTDLLALNAAIEAARAGENGRGFSVVAEEVRALAEQSAAATQQISDILGVIRREVNGAVSAMAVSDRQISDQSQTVAATGQSLREILNLFDTATSRIQEISAATEQQAANHEQVLSILRQVTGLAQEAGGRSTAMVASAKTQAEQAVLLARAVNELDHQANSLGELVAQFKVE